jgi:hypothetical protein
VIVYYPAILPTLHPNPIQHDACSSDAYMHVAQYQTPSRLMQQTHIPSHHPAVFVTKARARHLLHQHPTSITRSRCMFSNRTPFSVPYQPHIPGASTGLSLPLSFTPALYHAAIKTYRSCVPSDETLAHSPARFDFDYSPVLSVCVCVCKRSNGSSHLTCRRRSHLVCDKQRPPWLMLWITQLAVQPSSCRTTEPTNGETTALYVSIVFSWCVMLSVRLVRFTYLI